MARLKVLICRAIKAPITKIDLKLSLLNLQKFLSIKGTKMSINKKAKKTL
jgi:hypothetical protein